MFVIKPSEHKIVWVLCWTQTLELCFCVWLFCQENSGCKYKYGLWDCWRYQHQVQYRGPYLGDTQRFWELVFTRCHAWDDNKQHGTTSKTFQRTPSCQWLNCLCVCLHWKQGFGIQKFKATRKWGLDAFQRCLRV